MRTFIIAVCSLALACSAGAAQNNNKSKKEAQKNRPTQSVQRTATAGAAKRAMPNRYQAASSASYQKAKGRQGVNNQVYQSRSNVKARSAQQVTTRDMQAGRYATKKTKQDQQRINRQVYESRSNVNKTQKRSQQIAAQNAQAGRNATSANYSKKTKQWQGNTASAAALQTNGKKYRAQRFNLASNTRPTKYTAVKFQQNRRIQGSQYWQGRNYWAFRNYRPAWHDRGWWRSHYNRVVFAYGGWYYWNSGWWYPAWGYAPNSYYAYDGPIYAYNSLPPDQVVANVQAALQTQGYYQGEVDGLLGPLTREAIAGYQRDHGLYTTSAIDQPTLESLGMT
jgi:Putative peptidoglycan binding domain